MNRALWTPENLATLEAMWKAGNSARQIAMRLGNGCTRNAVLGKKHRLDIGCIPRKRGPKSANLKGSKPPARVPRKFQLPSPPSVSRSITLTHGDNAIRMRLRGPRKAVAPSPRARRPEVPPCPSAGVPVDLWGLTGCKWPVNEGDPVFLFCNGDRDGNGSYCAYHKHLSIQRGGRPAHPREVGLWPRRRLALSQAEPAP